MAADPALAASSTDTLSPMEVALHRLTVSRLRLRGALIPLPASASAQGAASDGPISRKVRAVWRQWRQRWRESPAVDLAFESVHSWWLNNPWREVVHTMADEVGRAVGPLVRKRPLTAVAAAAGLGLAIATVRPWRWSVVATQLVPLRRKAVNWVVGQALSAPVHTMVASLMAMVAIHRGPDEAAADAPPSETPVRTPPAARSAPPPAADPRHARDSPDPPPGANLER